MGLLALVWITNIECIVWVLFEAVPHSNHGTTAHRILLGSGHYPDSFVLGSALHFGWAVRAFTPLHPHRASSPKRKAKPGFKPPGRINRF